MDVILYDFSSILSGMVAVHSGDGMSRNYTLFKVGVK